MVQITCFSTLGCPDLSLRQSMDLARRRGLDQLELRAVSGSIDLVSALSSEFGQPAALAEHLGSANVAIPVFGTSHRLWDGDFRLGELEALAEWAEGAGVRNLRVFDGNSGDLSERDLDDAAARLDQWDNLRLRHGWQVRLILETHGTLCADHALATFCTRFPEQQILWDAHHTWAAGNALAQTRRTIGGRLAHIHVKDSAVVEGKRHYVLPGAGAFPIAALDEALAHHGGQAPVSLEWEALWHSELPDLETALDHAASWA